MEIKVILLGDPEYPDCLANIDNAPEKLYCIGDISLLKTTKVAVVGTRKASPYGKWVSYEIGRILAGCGVSVVSGMAYGIDGRAHEGCLSAGGKTIAVLGTPINNPYPKSNEDLYFRICSAGLVISEYGPGDTTGRWSFPARNRIISGLSKAVIVAEGAEKSGSMITAGFALNQGRDVLAVPGNINQPNSVGVNLLIRDGALPITRLEDIPWMLGIEPGTLNKKMSSCSNEESCVLKSVIGNPGISIEKAAYICGYNVWNCSVLVSSLELKGFVRKDGNKIFPVL